MYNFKRLIKKYSKHPVNSIKITEGYRDPEQGGIFVPGETKEIEIQGAILQLSNNELMLDEGGTYTTEDRKLYCYENLEKGTKVEHKDYEYTIKDDVDYSDFDDGLMIYFIKRVGGRD